MTKKRKSPTSAQLALHNARLAQKSAEAEWGALASILEGSEDELAEERAARIAAETQLQELQAAREQLQSLLEQERAGYFELEATAEELRTRLEFLLLEQEDEGEPEETPEIPTWMHALVAAANTFNGLENEDRRMIVQGLTGSLPGDEEGEAEPGSVLELEPESYDLERDPEVLFADITDLKAEIAQLKKALNLANKNKGRAANRRAESRKKLREALATLKQLRAQAEDTTHLKQKFAKLEALYTSQSTEFKTFKREKAKLKRLIDRLETDLKTVRKERVTTRRALRSTTGKLEPLAAASEDLQAWKLRIAEAEEEFDARKAGIRKQQEVSAEVQAELAATRAEKALIQQQVAKLNAERRQMEWERLYHQLQMKVAGERGLTAPISVPGMNEQNLPGVNSLTDCLESGNLDSGEARGIIISQLKRMIVTTDTLARIFAAESSGKHLEGVYIKKMEPPKKSEEKSRNSLLDTCKLGALKNIRQYCADMITLTHSSEALDDGKVYIEYNVNKEKKWIQNNADQLKYVALRCIYLLLAFEINEVELQELLPEPAFYLVEKP